MDETLQVNLHYNAKVSQFPSNSQISSKSPISTCSTFVKTLANIRHFCRMCHFHQNHHSEREPFATSRGVARIFSEVRTILQIALHPVTPTNKNILDKRLIWLCCKPKGLFCLWITLSGVWVHWLMHLTHLSHRKATYFSRFVTFCYWVRFVVFKQMQRVNPNWKGAYFGQVSMDFETEI